MGDKRNYAALDWVIGEIGETLKDARQSLESYVEDPRDTARIRFCLTHIHQVHGSLQMVEFHGASLFAEEMELLATAIMNGQVINEPEAHEALMRSLLQLPLYLEQVKSLHEDHPAVVLPLLNDLRAVRKESYLSETNLFNPDLSSLGKIRGERHPILQDQAKLKQVIHKLREMYQYAAASVLRGIKIDENLAYVDKVVSRLEGITRGTASHPTWQVSAALVEALARDDVELSIAVRGLLRYLARELKTLEEHCPAALESPAREPLLRNLLYYVARAEGEGPRVAQVKRQYGLQNAILGGNTSRLQMGKGPVSPPEPEAVRAVIVALQDELNTAKHLLDLALSGQGGMSDLEEMLPYVKRISDTLAVLGIGELRKQTQAQHDALASICETGDYTDSGLLDLATGLANIEHRLEAIGKGASKNRDYANVDEREVEVDSARDALLEECRAGLESVKNAIIESMAGQWDTSPLPPTIDTLHYVYGALNMVPLERPARVLDTCGEFIRQTLLSAASAPTEELQTLAEAIASVDYFLERLQGGHGDDLDVYLDMAEASLAQLGYNLTPPAADASLNGEPSAEEEPIGEEPSANEELSANEEPSAEQDSAIEQPFASEPSSAEASPPPAAENESFAEFEPSADDQALGENQAPPLEPTIDMAAPGEGADDQSEASIAEVEPDPLDDVSLELPEQAAADSQQAPVEDEGESDIDDEIVEIFIEEADEVLQTLGETLPQWRDNMGDEQSLGVIRRAFHTLKGSGRMVEAFDVGELAWAVENMLNRVLGHSVTPEEAHAHLIDQVLGLVPVLVDAFKNRQPNPNPEAHAQYIAWAEQMAAGQVPEALHGSGSYRDFTPAQVEDDAPVEATAMDDDGHALWEIFASEANTHLQVVDEYVAQMDEAAPLYTTPSDDLQRALHTLKGSAHMAAVTPIAAMITPLETFVKELRGYQLRIDDDILQLLKDASSYTRDGLECIERRQPVVLPKLEQFLARVDELYDRYIAPLIHMREQGTMVEGQAVDPTMLTTFMSADMSLLLEADRLMRQWQGEGRIESEAVVELYTELRQLHEVAAQANLAELQHLAQLLSEVYQGIDSAQVEMNDAAFDTLVAAHETLLDMFDQVAAAMTVQPASEELQDQLHRLLPEASAEEFAAGEIAPAADAQTGEEDYPAANAVAADAEIAEADYADDFIGEGFSEEEIAAAEQEAGAPEHTEDDSAAGLETEQTFAEQYTGAGEDDQQADTDSTIEPGADKGGAEGERPVEEQTFAGQDINDGESATDVPADDAREQLSETAAEDTFASEPQHEQNAGAEDAGEWTVEPTFAEQDANAEDEGGMQLPDGEPGDEALPEQTFAEQDVAADEHEHLQAELTEHESAGADSQPSGTDEADAAGGHQPAATDVGFIEEDDFDPDILEIFLEEAGELIEELDEAIHNWDSNWDDRDAPETMKRALHTLKGGARLSGLKNLGELTHDYESYLITTGGPRHDQSFFPAIHAYQDNVLTAVRAVRARLDGEPAPEAGKPVPPPAARIADEQDQQASADIVPFSRRDEPPEVDEDGGFVTPAPKPQTNVAASNKRQGSQEMIKVSADLLEELVNLAGETSISRGRLEQQVSDLGSAVDEVDSTLRRLNEQLRRLDLETDAQVSFRQEQMAAHEGFDPLEMDRYSQLQQLTRSLMESASDLGDLKNTLTDKIRDTETLLLQQSRINSALQEGLMRSRMVPFSRLVPRLRRIVRQVSGELGKHVNFELDNVEGEMDRSVLERMVAPLEHMLRNAVDHGIELPDERLDQGKPETGRILLSLAREGGDILLRMADDGRGIHLDRVREKAIERGLMAADADLSDHDIMQFILQAGFSTAENVTQISGRGVGMDVVAAEIKQLGGSIVIDSRSGVGTQFTVRLPFTVSVNRALMVQLGSETYAIPLNTIEGIVRVSPFELEHYYNHPDARFEYAGENYQVRHLGSMLTADLQPKLEGQVLPLPVILVRTAQHTMALQVDGLMGSREIVVKSLGPQFAAVQGLSGATVMGDGSVVVILDPHALVRREVAQSALPAPAKPLPAPVELAPELKTIMVVDDSVTVRKVTSRFLEREGYDVITAKDGVDALQLLQEEVPDLMLLDIEMPRMDGFEVAKNIRSTRRLKHLPIIMITSRTGDKHRQHALSIGVNEYMGKPYQEEALLRAMQSLLAKRSASA